MSYFRKYVHKICFIIGAVLVAAGSISLIESNAGKCIAVGCAFIVVTACSLMPDFD